MTDSNGIEREQTRREFIKRSSALPLARLATLSVQHKVHAAGSDVIKVGMIGCGGRGSGAAAQAMNADRGVRITAMADLFADRLGRSRKNLRAENASQMAVDDDHCFTGFDGYKRVIDSGVDVVLIANASRFQARHFEACVDADLHTFVEKPAAMDPPDVKRLSTSAEKAQQKGLSVVSGQMWRYDPAIAETVKRVHDGAIGDIVAIQITTHRDNFRLRPRKPAYSEIEYQLYNWTHFSWLSGDFLTASLVHHTDLAAWAMKEEQPATAFGMGGRAAEFDAEHGDCFDHNAVIYEYANGVKLFAFLIVQPNCYTEVSDIVMGTKGRAHLQAGRIEGENQWRYRGERANPYQIEQDELFASVRSGIPINNGRYMALSAMTGIMGQMATYTGKKIEWDQARKAGHVFGPPECEPPVKPRPDGTYPVRIPGVSKLLS
jgi:predicted dehydrogenase